MTRRSLVGLLAVMAVPAAARSGTGDDRWPTRGGAGGREIVVTSLADNGPGSLRQAVSARGRRIVKFAVGGEIWLKSMLLINHPDITVDGATAPSPGITLMGDKIRLRTHDVILRHLRIRVGELPGGSDAQNRDGISVDGSPDDPFYNILIDHCSVSWAIDETIQFWGLNGHDAAVTNSILAEGLMHSIHPKGGHSFGLLIGPGQTNMLAQGNLLAHNMGRNPVVAGGSSAVIVNNLVYNPGFAALHFYERPNEPPALVSAVGNVVIAGPDSKRLLRSFSGGINPGSRVFYRDNTTIGTVAFLEGEPVKGRAELPSPIVHEPPVWREGLQVLPASEVEAAVLAHAGARPWDRDAVDQRIIAEVRARQGRIRDTPTDPRLGRTAAGDIDTSHEEARP